MKNVLVTGGTGFIGSNLTERLLARGINVRILRRRDSSPATLEGIDVEAMIGDVRDIDSLKKAMKGCDTVFHTAAMVTFERCKAELQMEINVTGTRNVVEASLASGIDRLVHTSSIAAIGHPPDGTLASEETPFNWERKWGYKFSKFKAEEEITGGGAKGLSAVIVNPSVVVGERDIHFHGSDIIRRVKKNQVPMYVSGGMNVVYVGDVVDGHIAAAERGRPGERYILGGENLTHQQVFTRTAKLVGGLPPMVKLPLPLLRSAAIFLEKAADLLHVEPIVTRDLVAGAGRFNWYSSEKAERELGYSITPFEEAVRRAYAWYKAKRLL